MNDKTSDGSFLASVLVIGFCFIISVFLICHYTAKAVKTKANAEVKKVQIEQQQDVSTYTVDDKNFKVMPTEHNEVEQMVP